MNQELCSCEEAVRRTQSEFLSNRCESCDGKLKYLCSCAGSITRSQAEKLHNKCDVCNKNFRCFEGENDTYSSASEDHIYENIESTRAQFEGLGLNEKKKGYSDILEIAALNSNHRAYKSTGDIQAVYSDTLLIEEGDSPRKTTFDRIAVSEQCIYSNTDDTVRLHKYETIPLSESVIGRRESDQRYPFAVTGNITPFVETHLDPPDSDHISVHLANNMSHSGETNKIMGLRIPRFEARKSDVRKFFVRLEKYFAQYPNLSDEMKVNYLANVVCDDALEFLETLPTELTNDFDSVQKEFIEHYDELKTGSSQWVLLTGRKQQKHETVTEYHDALTKLGKGIEIGPEEWLYIFLSGLPEETRNYIALLSDPPTDMKTAFRYAKNHQNVVNRGSSLESTPTVNSVETKRLAELESKIDKFEKWQNQNKNFQENMERKLGTKHCELTAELLSLK